MTQNPAADDLHELHDLHGSHAILGGKVRLYRRGAAGKWQCSSFLEGKNYRAATGELDRDRAEVFAENWYIDLRGRQRSGELKKKTGPTFRDVALRWEAEFDIMTGGTRNRTYVDGNSRRLAKYLIPFFGDLAIGEVSTTKVHEYRLLRMTPVEGKIPARSTFHQEMVTLRQVLKAGMRYGMIQTLPDLSEPYTSGHKVSHRAWFTLSEYNLFVRTARENIKRLAKTRHRASAEQFLDFVLIMSNTGLRPDEAKRIQYRDVEIAEDAETKQTILIISVRGKRGTGYCKSTEMAVYPFERMVKRNNPKPSDLLFPGDHYRMMQKTLDLADLRFDREGQPRSAYSLRHTYISMRLEEGADIYQIAKNCRTSVEMIEKHYASHITNSISAAAVNTRKRPLSAKKQAELEARNAHRAARDLPTPRYDEGVMEEGERPKPTAP